MSESIWLAMVSILLTIIIGLFSMGYGNIRSRLTRLEEQDKKLFAAILTLLIAKADDARAVADAIHGLLQTGIGSAMGGD